MTVLNCKGCGKPHRAEIGDSIQCDCGRIITVTRPTDSTLSRHPPPVVENVPPQPKLPWIPAPPLESRRLIRNWLLPTFGILTLLVGASLILVSYRNRNNTTLVAQTSPSPTAVVPIATPYTDMPATPTPSPKLRPSSTPTPPDPNDPQGIDKFLAQNSKLRATPTPDPALDDVFDPTPTPAARPRTTRSPDDTNVGPVFRARPTGTFDNPRITVTNDSSRTLTLTFGGERIVIVAHAVQTITKPPGTYSYTASAPGVIPASGSHAFEIGYIYEWTFYISSTYR